MISIVASQRRLICVSVDENLVAHDNRYEPYETIVDKTDNTSWLCPQKESLTMWNYNCLPALENVMRNEPPGKFRRYRLMDMCFIKTCSQKSHIQT